MKVLVGKRESNHSFLCTGLNHQSKLLPVLTSLEILISSLAKKDYFCYVSPPALRNSMCIFPWKFKNYTLNKALSVNGEMTSLCYKVQFSLLEPINTAWKSLSWIQILSLFIWHFLLKYLNLNVFWKQEFFSKLSPFYHSYHETEI